MVLPTPAPASVIGLESVSVDVHEQLPAGMLTVSPDDAELIADCTSLSEQEAALMVAARALAKFKQSTKRTIREKTN